MRTLIIATRNRHKVEEISAILGNHLRYLTLRDLPDAPEIIEDAATFSGNAAKKATGLSSWLKNLPPSAANWAGDDTQVIADDSGLEVDALDGAPGVYSARFAALDTGEKGNSPDAKNNAKLLRLLAGVPIEKRTARFRCCIALAAVPPPVRENCSPVCYASEWDMTPVHFSGVCEGHIQLQPAGAGGFGYDPLFVPVGFTSSFAELGEEVKNRISHRAQALESLKAHLKV